MAFAVWGDGMRRRAGLNPSESQNGVMARSYRRLLGELGHQSRRAVGGPPLTIPGGIAMSTMVMDVRPLGHEAVSMFDAVVGHSHPRGQGFRVLSRIARTQACEDDYAPRHRRDVPAELDLRVAIAG